MYNTETEKVGFVKVVPRDDWGGAGMLGADISFGFLNKLPLRKADVALAEKRSRMTGIFNKLTTNTEAQAHERVSSDEEDIGLEEQIEEAKD